MYIFEKEFRDFTKKDIQSNSFVVDFLRHNKDRYLDMVVTTSPRGSFYMPHDIGNFDERIISEYGIRKTRDFIRAYISTDLDQGLNIASQAVNTLKTPEDWLVVINKILPKLHFKPATGCEQFKLDFKEFNY